MSGVGKHHPDPEKSRANRTELKGWTYFVSPVQEEFEKTREYVLEKNKELNERLADE